MRVLLRDTGTRLFYVGFHQWSYEARTARDFCTVANAEDHAAAEQLRGLDVVLRYDDPACELVLPLETKTPLA